MSNHITITGRLATDPDLRFAATGTAMCTVVVPDQKSKKNEATGQWEEQSATTWFRATVFKEKAEALAAIAKKGDTVTVSGRLITREWTNKDGEVKSSLEVDFATVAVVPREVRAERSQGQPAADPWATTAQPTAAAWGQPVTNDEPPFAFPPNSPVA